MRDISIKLKFGVLFLLTGLCFKTSCAEIKPDTVCAYYLNHNKNHLQTIVIHNENELTNFLNSTAYKNSKITKKLIDTPDFKRNTFFAFSGWPCTLLSAIENNDTVMVQYKEEYRVHERNDVEYSRPSDVAVIYTIPNVFKTIHFVDCTDRSKDKQNK